MKTKTLITSMALAGALVASTSVVKANAFLEVISGGQSASTSAVGSQADLSLAASVGGWFFTINSGAAAFAPLSIDLGSYDLGIGAGPLEIIYRTAWYPQHGPWTFLTTSSSTPGTTIVADAYSNGNLLASENVLAYGGSVLASGTLNHHLGVFEEDLWITPQTTGQISMSVDSYFNLTPVGCPDGGLTVAMLGCVLVGFAGIRSRLGKRS